MATIVRTKEGSWRVQVRRKGKYASQTFRLKSLANERAIETQRLIDLGGNPTHRRIRDPKTVGDLIDLHVSDMHEVGRPLRRSKQAVMDAFKRDLGATRIKRIDRAAVIKYGQQRAKQGAGPVTLAVDLSYLRTALTHAAAIHGISVDTESVRLARTALTRLGLVGRSVERDRRPTEDEIDARREIARRRHARWRLRGFGGRKHLFERLGVVGCQLDSGRSPRHRGNRTASIDA